MKRKGLFLVFLSLFLFASCGLNTNEYGTIKITFPYGDGSLPDSSVLSDFTNPLMKTTDTSYDFTIYFKNDSEEFVKTGKSGDTIILDNVKTGNYDIKVESINIKGYLIYNGSAETVVKSGETSNVTIELSKVDGSKADHIELTTDANGIKITLKNVASLKNYTVTEDTYGIYYEKPVTDTNSSFVYPFTVTDAYYGFIFEADGIKETVYCQAGGGNPLLIDYSKIPTAANIKSDEAKVGFGSNVKLLDVAFGNSDASNPIFIMTNESSRYLDWSVAIDGTEMYSKQILYGTDVYETLTATTVLINAAEEAFYKEYSLKDWLGGYGSWALKIKSTFGVNIAGSIVNLHFPLIEMNVKTNLGKDMGFLNYFEDYEIPNYPEYIVTAVYRSSTKDTTPMGKFTNINYNNDTDAKKASFTLSIPATSEADGNYLFWVGYKGSLIQTNNQFIIFGKKTTNDEELPEATIYIKDKDNRYYSSSSTSGTATGAGTTTVTGTTTGAGTAKVSWFVSSLSVFESEQESLNNQTAGACIMRIDDRLPSDPYLYVEIKDAGTYTYLINYQ